MRIFYLKTFLVVLFFSLFSGVSGQVKVDYVDYKDVLKEIEGDVESENYDAAIKKLEQVNPNDSVYYSLLTTIAYYYLLDDKYEECIKACDKGLAGDDWLVDKYYFYLNKAAAQQSLEQYDESIATNTEALKRYPKGYTFLFNRSIDYEKKGELKKATEDLMESVKINPFYVKAHLRLGNLFADQNKTAQALICLDTYLMLSPDGKYSAAVWELAENIADRSNVGKLKSKVSLTEDDSYFNELNTLLNSKAAIDKKYKTHNKIRSALALQTHLILEYLKEKKIGTGFFQERYVRLFKWIQETGQYNSMIYTIHVDSPVRSYKTIASKKIAVIKSYIVKFYKEWTKINEKNKEFFNEKEQEVFYVYDNQELVGVIEDYKDGMLNGYAVLYNKYGAKVSEGEFKDSKKEGLWTVYRTDGTVRKKVELKNDLKDGVFSLYNVWGVKTHEAHYKENIANGEVKNYYKEGALNSVSTYKDDKLEGIYTRYFYPGLAKKFTVNYTDGKLEGEYKEFYSNGKVYSMVNFKNDYKEGEQKEFFSDGKLYTTKFYTEGLLEGESIEYYYNGKVANKGTWKNGLEDGKWVYYYNNGKKDNEYTAVKGLIDGEYLSYDIDGTLVGKYQYKNGKFVGYQLFDKDGNQIKEAKKQKGKFYFVLKYSNGNLRTEGEYDVKGGKIGVWKYYRRNGTLLSKEIYSDGKLNGQGINYFTTGEKRTVIDYKEGKKDGYYAEYWRNGYIKEQGNYKDDKKVGEWISYHPNGNINGLRYFSNGKQTGKTVYYTTDKKVAEEQYLFDDFVYKYVLFSDTVNPPNILEMPFDSVRTVERKYIDGTLRSKGTKIYNTYNGVYKYFGVNGQLEMEGNFVFGKRDGEWKWYNENGTIKQTGTYDLGDKIGKWISYYDNKQINTIEFYKMGKQDSIETTYNKEGKIIRESQYFEDEFHGYRKFYSEEGKLQLVRYYEYGYLIGWSHLDKNGKLLPMIPIKNETAKIKSLFDNGKVARDFEMVNGQFHGDYKEYYYSGQLFEIQHYKYGMETGEHISYYPNGKVKQKVTYKNDNKEGEEIEYYETGTIKRKATYTGGDLYGKEYYYNKKGELTKTIYYFDDVEVGMKKN